MNLTVITSIIAYCLTILLLIAFLSVGYILLRQLGIIKKAKKLKIKDKITKFAKFWGRGVKPGFLNDNVKMFIRIILLVIASRLVIYLIGYLGVMIFHNEAGGLIDSFQQLWNRTDSPLYLNIARNWYVNHGEDRFLIVFYPLYPILIRVLSYLIPDYFLAGLVISTFSLIIASIYLYQLVQLDFNEQVAYNSVIFLLIFPFSFFMGLVLSDSLFLALTVMTFYYMRKRKWFLAGLLGGLASLTRNFGILLLIPVGIEYLAATKLVQMIKAKNWRKIFSDFAHSGSDLLLIPFGQIIYLLINKLVTGDWFTFLTYQSRHWNHDVNLDILSGLTDYLKMALIWKPTDAASLWIPQIVLVLAVVLMVFYALRKVRSSYLTYILVYLFTCLATTWLISGPRYLSGLFPIYIILALLSRNRMHNFMITLISILTLCCYTVAFVLGLPIY